MITRITKLKGFNAVLAGRDLANIFKEGHVYAVTEIMGQILINDLGEHAEIRGGYGLGAILTDGTYCLTKEEDKKQRDV